MSRGKKVAQAQVSAFAEILVDSFAGGGGASTGLELALGREVSIAINHDPAAILMHKTNHPYTEHYQASVWDIDPREVCRGRPVGVAWFSPDCKHFSKAKGAALVDRNIRGLAWITLRWAGTVRPRVIFLENVEEFQTWGPVRKGKPVKKKAGQTFQTFITQLRDLGYEVEWRELVAADYGTPTTRKRFVMIARCDGKPIVWPERTHAPRDSEEVKSGKLLPWRSAAEVIDWSLPCPSIFDTKAEIMDKYGLKAVRPLADNTMRRVIRGVDKFTIKSGEPFIVECNHGGDGHTRGAAEPVNTITGKYTGGLCEPVMAPFTFSNTGGSVGADAASPVHTIRTAGGQILSAASLIQYHTEQTENVRASGLGGPIQTIDASNRYGLTCANLVEYYGNGNPLDVQEPMHTVTGHDREAVVAAHMVKFKGDNLGSSPADPVQTVTAGAGRHRSCGGGNFAVCKTRLCKADAQQSAGLGHWPQIRALLNKHCGYKLAEDDLLLLDFGGALYYIADIGLRMLTPRELYKAMGFPDDYKIETDYKGNPYPKNEQVARCGNAVCPPLAAAVARANLPEWARKDIKTMEQLEQAVAV